MSNCIISEEQRKVIADGFYRILEAQQKLEEPLSESRQDGAPVNKPGKYLQQFARGKILFVGTGAGWEVAQARDLGFDAYGITLGKDNIVFGREILGIPPEKFVEGPNEVLPFDKEVFDIVAGFQIFEHCISPMLFLREQYRVLKIEGTILLEWPPSHPTSSHDRKHQICLTPGQADALLHKAGFRDIIMRYSNYATHEIYPVPSKDYWQGHPEHGYVLAQAKKAHCNMFEEYTND